MKSIFVFLMLLAMTAQVLAMEITKASAGTADGKQVDHGSHVKAGAINYEQA